MPSKRKVQAQTDESDSPVVSAWSNSTVAELKAELESRGLTKAGVKADLVARLQAADNDRPAPPEPAAMESAPKRKRAKKQATPDVEIAGSTAAQLIVNQNSNRATGEKRPRDFVPEPTEEYKKKLKKVQKERMFMLDRQKSIDKEGYMCELFDIAGSKGNIYRTTIGRQPHCVCMDARTRGQKCKHINYALVIILKAPAHMCYQLAFLSDEIASIFANAPVTRAVELEQKQNDGEETYNGSRKPVDGECPICVFDMEPDEDIVWCKASCGQNFHKNCFDMWKQSKQGGTVTCVYCRAEWQDDARDAAAIINSAPKIGSYRNIGHLPMYQ